ncbi:MAG TPA: hypothetical protein VFB38_13250 [Chthonomonadaceae bacterium]|nr:hypothetical protein [Chthonomonadaceae bacterium]
MGALGQEPPSGPLPGRFPPRRDARRLIVAALIVLLLGVGLPPLLSWQRSEDQRATSLSNLRRLGMGFLLYAQDYDGRAMPPVLRRPDGSWLTWDISLRPYVGLPALFDNPSNPVGPQTHHPTDGYRVHTSYALNRRLWDTFAPGPFPFENLELPEQTVLFVEAGPMWRDPLHPPRPGERSALALLVYGDTTDRVNGLCPYPSSHDGRMALIAADGHTTTVKVEHYGPRSGPHDTLYGRIGGNTYNWNGGHPNGETDRPARE